MYSYKNNLLISSEREIFKNIYHERLNKIEELSKKINYTDLIFIINSSGLKTDFKGLKDPAFFNIILIIIIIIIIIVINYIKTNKILGEEAQYKQEEFGKYLK